MTISVLLGIVCVAESISLIVMTWIIGRFVQEHARLARAFARSRAPGVVFRETKRDENEKQKHVTLSEKQIRRKKRP